MTDNDSVKRVEEDGWGGEEGGGRRERNFGTCGRGQRGVFIKGGE